MVQPRAHCNIYSNSCLKAGKVELALTFGGKLFHNLVQDVKQAIVNLIVVYLFEFCLLSYVFYVYQFYISLLATSSNLI